VSQQSEVPEDCYQPWAMYFNVFATDQSTLSDSAKLILNKFASISASCPQTNYIVETHADTRAAEQYNQILTVARAYTIKEYLMSLGMQFSKVQTRPLGESQPLSNGSTDEDHAANRRVVILPTGVAAVQTALSDQ